MGSIASCNWKEYYAKAAALASSDNPQMVFAAAEMLHEMVSATFDRSGVLRHGYAGKEDAEHILEMWLTEGRIRCIPDEDDKCESPLNGFGEYFPSLEITLVRNKAIS